MVELGPVSTADGRILTFSEWGPPDGYPTFFLHGTPGGRLLRHVGGEYDRAGVRAITYDRPGYGGSDRLPGRNVSHAAGDVAAIADRLGLEAFSVLGVSGGGPHALAVAAGLPDRVTRCASIVGMGPFEVPDLDFFEGMNEEAVEQWRLEQQGEAYLIGPMYEETRAFVESLGDLDLTPILLDMLQEAARDGLAAGPYGMADDCTSFAMPWGFDVADIRCPTTVMIAREDTDTPRGHGLWIEAHVPDAKLVEVGGGHFGPRDQPEEALLAWAAGAEFPWR